MDTFVCTYSQSIVKHNILPYLTFKDKGRLKEINKNANKRIPNEMPFHRSFSRSVCLAYEVRHMVTLSYDRSTFCGTERASGVTTVYRNTSPILTWSMLTQKRKKT